MSATMTATAPTEAEIRSAVTEALDDEPGSTIARGGQRAQLRLTAEEVGHALSHAAFDALGAEPEDRADISAQYGIWVDLRASEAVRLQELVDAAIERAGARCEAVIVEELTAAGLAFASEYPDAPRGKPPVSDAE